MRWLYRYSLHIIPPNRWACVFLKRPNVNRQYVLHISSSFKIFVFIFSITWLNLKYSPAQAQDFKPISDNDIKILDRAISSDKIDVYLAANGNIDSRGYSCNLIENHGKEGKYKTVLGEEISINGRNLQISVAPSKRLVVQEHMGADQNCTPPINSYSEMGVVIRKDGVPIVLKYKLAHSICYVHAIYTDCTNKCLARASAGSEFYYIVLEKKLAEKISNYACE